MFWKKWEITVDLNWKDVEEFEMFVLESWAEDFNTTIVPAEDWNEEQKFATVITEISDFAQVRDLIKSEWYELTWASIWWIPNQKMALDDEEKLEKLHNLIEFLEENDDVDDVYTNLES